jgi:FlaA1/EpsC-like NDP-sugar epimerase
MSGNPRGGPSPKREVPFAVGYGSGALLRQLRRLLSYWHSPLVHLVLIVGGYWLAYGLRFDFNIPPHYVNLFWISLPVLASLRLCAYALAGVFRGYWVHFGLQDLFTLAQAITLSSLAFVMVLWLGGISKAVPRSVLLLDWAAAIFFAGGVPFIARSLREVRVPFIARRGRRTVVVGAGERAARLLHEIRMESGHSLDVVGLVDLTGSEQGRSIRGVRVLGTVDGLPALVERLKAEFAVIAIEPGETAEIRRIVEQCIAAGIEFKTLPSLNELLERTAGLKQLRDVNMDDLLGRRPVSLDLSHVRADLSGRVVLLTGAAGSIGSELARQIAQFDPARLVLLDQAESDLYFVHLELGKSHPALELVPVICDVTNPDGLTRVYAQHRPEYVVHAAAYKHVPLMETNVVEAVRNNVLGTLHVATAAVQYGAKQVLLISTDKAINPSCVMGATKRIAERMIFGLTALRSNTDFRAVRFGNVLASNGSVIPLFERQLADGGPLTVTDPAVERYFMTIPEAVQLVLQAGSLPETAGAITMLEMGEPVRIVELAEKLIRFSGRVPGRDVQIVFTGLRPGEKLTEDLVSALEATVRTSAEKIRISRSTESGGPQLERQLTNLLTCLDIGDREELLAAICDLVPECVPPLHAWVRSSPADRPQELEHTIAARPSVRTLKWGLRRPGERRSPDIGTPSHDRRVNGGCRRVGGRRRGGRRRGDKPGLLQASSMD